MSWRQLRRVRSGVRCGLAMGAAVEETYLIGLVPVVARSLAPLPRLLRLQSPGPIKKMERYTVQRGHES